MAHCSPHSRKFCLYVNLLKGPGDDRGASALKPDFPGAAVTSVPPRVGHASAVSGKAGLAPGGSGQLGSA